MKKIGICSIFLSIIILFGACVESKKVDSFETILCKGRSLETNCRVTFYSDKNGTYLSEQHHQIGLSEPFIKIQAKETTGNAECKLSGVDFYVKKPMPEDINSLIYDPAYAKILLTMMTLKSSDSYASL